MSLETLDVLCRRNKEEIKDMGLRNPRIPESSGRKVEL